MAAGTARKNKEIRKITSPRGKDDKKSKADRKSEEGKQSKEPSARQPQTIGKLDFLPEIHISDDLEVDVDESGGAVL